MTAAQPDPDRPLPPHVTAAQFERALQAFRGTVGAQWVLASAEDRETYQDVYAPLPQRAHLPAAAVAPQSVEEVQAILRLANEHRIPLWPISRGKNLGYGGSAPVLSGSVVLDLTRMKRILEVDSKRGYCLIEPGVGFFDLYDYLQKSQIPLWMSVPSNAWGSVVGNALERGIGYTPYGENAGQICGMEVALPSGELVRTGMGAMNGNHAWQLYKYGFGPAWDQMFSQSNFGVVTKLGLWLMPEPEATHTLQFDLSNPEDVVWALDTLAELKLRRVIESSVTMGVPLRTAAVRSQRSEWYQGADVIPESVERAMMRKYDIGWWTYAVRLFGYRDVVEANARIVKNAFAGRPPHRMTETRWARGEPLGNSGANIPSVTSLQVVNWHGGRGGHLGFSPVMPHDGARAFEQYQRTRARYREFGLDYSGGFTLAERYMTNVNMIFYDRDNRDMTSRTMQLFAALVGDAAKAGYGEYRTHLSFMDQVAHSFDFNDHALLRLNEVVKDAIDPNGILAPGKSGIWPRAYRKERT